MTLVVLNMMEELRNLIENSLSYLTLSLLYNKNDSEATEAKSMGSDPPKIYYGNKGEEEEVEASIGAGNLRRRLTEEEQLQLEEQIRMFVQLVTQSYLLSFNYPSLYFINESSKKMLEELKEIASSGNVAFNAYNLDDALAIVNDYENGKEKFRMRNVKRKAKNGMCGLPNKAVKDTIYKSKVFMYPELLPLSGFRNELLNLKPTFTPAEDNLIAIGLERSLSSEEIESNLIACKTAKQISVRIKNAKCKFPVLNPIKYYVKHKKAPPSQRTVKEFDPKNVKAPKDQPMEILPDWMKSIGSVQQKNQAVPVRTILPLAAIPREIVMKPLKSKFIPREIVMKPLKPKLNPQKPRLILPKLTATPLHFSVTCLNSENDTSSKTKLIDNFGNVMYLMNSNIVNVDSACVANSNVNNFHEKSQIVLDETKIQDVNNASCLPSSEVSKVTEFACDTSTKVCENAVKSEITDSSEISTDGLCASNSGIKRTHDINSVIKSNALQVAHYKNFKRRKTKNEEKDEILSSPLSNNDFPICEYNIPIKQEIVDDSENSSNTHNLAFNKSTEKDEMLQPVSDFGANVLTESEVTEKKEENDEVPTLPLLNNNISIKQEIVEDSENSSNTHNLACYKTTEKDKILDHVSDFGANIPIKSEVTDTAKSTQDACNMPCLVNHKKGSTRMVKSNALQTAFRRCARSRLKKK